MKKDLYTKVVLTIIACCLVILVIQNTTIVPKAKANNPVALSIPDSSLQEDTKVIDVNIVSINGEAITVRKWGKQGGIPVYILNP